MKITPRGGVRCENLFDRYCFLNCSRNESVYLLIDNTLVDFFFVLDDIFIVFLGISEN